jgi:hypothetical protein
MVMISYKLPICFETDIYSNVSLTIKAIQVSVVAYGYDLRRYIDLHPQEPCDPRC